MADGDQSGWPGVGSRCFDRDADAAMVLDLGGKHQLGELDLLSRRHAGVLWTD